MAPPLTDLRFVAVGAGPVLDDAVALLELLGAAVVRFERLAGPVHAARAADIEAVGGIDVTGTLGDPPYPVLRLASTDPAAAWVASGAAALTGAATGPAWSAPGRLAERVLAAGAVVQLLAACRGHVLDLDPLALLGERAALLGATRRGTTSIGGSAEVVACADGWVACNLARPEDVASLPALVDGEVATDDWPAVVAAIGRRPGAQLAAQAGLLGVPLGVWPGPEGLAAAAPFRIDGTAPRARLRPTADGGADSSPHDDDSHRQPLVVDLSGLWAGPLASSLVGATDVRVIKVEGATRPDGARRGPELFYDLLNHGKQTVALDFTDEADRALLRALLAAADVVVESSRPRVMVQLGIGPALVARPGPGARPTTWISITGYGHDGEDRNRVAFGDDAAFAAGCTVGEPGAEPMFVADAVADPITGLYGAACALAALVGRRGQVVDLSLVGAAAYARGAGGAQAVPITDAVAVPHARARPGHARPHGADTEAVRAEFALVSPA